MCPWEDRVKTLIRNGRIVTAQDDYQADLLIDGEVISAIGRSLTPEADQVVDASGLLVLPGGVDVHTHLDMPFGGTVSSDDFETGTRAAAYGGTTTLIDFAIQSRGQSMRAALDTWFHKAEAKATGRAIALAETADAPVYIVHLSCAEALGKVREARDRGIPAYAETSPQYLFLSIEDYDRPGFEGAKYVFTPPLREKWNQEELWRGLAQDHLQVISTDHCPFCFKEQKELGRDDFTKIPNGGPGVETRLSLVYNGGVRTGKITLNRFVELVSTAPAKMFGLFPRKGAITVGSDADVALFDPEAEATI